MYNQEVTCRAIFTVLLKGGGDKELQLQELYMYNVKLCKKCIASHNFCKAREVQAIT